MSPIVSLLSVSLFPFLAADLPGDWALRAVNAYEAWNILAEKQFAPGEGVVIAHIDTGLSRHPELAGANIWWEKARNFIDNNSSVEHRFSRGQFPVHGHGSETLSVIVSPAGCPSQDVPEPCVTGVAPAAKIMPLLVSDNSIIGSGTLVAQAIYYAADEGAHVINISLGNVSPMPDVEAALTYAKRRGVIVIAAAGNSTGNVKVYPGAYSGAIAVGGTTSLGEAWSGSSRGEHVAWSAPALDVFAAFTKKGTSGFTYSVGRAAGTSDATALTSGIAALWLAYHGRDKLLARYGGAGLVDAFRTVVINEGVVMPSNWPSDSYGAGIINAQKVLQAELP